MVKKFLDWVWSNFDQVSDIISVVGAAYLLFRYLWGEPKPSGSELSAGILAILSILAISGFVEKRSRLTRMEHLIGTGNVLLNNKIINRVRADEFFQRDQKVAEDFFSLANTIYISGITLGNTTRQFAYILGERLKAGAKIKIMLLEPDHSALKQLDLRSWGETSPEYYKKRLEGTIDLIEIIGRTSGAKGSLEIGLLPYVPSIGIIMKDSNTLHGEAYISIYHHNSAEPSPSFRLGKDIDPHWFNFFQEQFDLMWKQSSQRVLLEDGSNQYDTKNKSLTHEE